MTQKAYTVCVDDAYLQYTVSISNPNFNF